MEVIAELKKAIDKRGLKKSWIAKQLDITDGHLSFILSGKRPFSKRAKGLLAELFPEVDFDKPENLASPEQDMPLPHEQLERDEEHIRKKRIWKDSDFPKQ